MQELGTRYEFDPLRAWGEELSDGLTTLND